MQVTRRPPRRRHPALIDTPVGEYNPAAAGIVRGYPSTLEGYERRRDALRANSEKARAEGNLDHTRAGIPNGFRGQRSVVEAIRRNSQTEAEMICEVLYPEGALRTRDDQLAAEAMEAIVEIWRSPLTPLPMRLYAMRLFLSFTVAPPVAKRLAAVGDPMALLDGALTEAKRRRNEAGETEAT
jgi:hypothetical protein